MFNSLLIIRKSFTALALVLFSVAVSAFLLLGTAVAFAAAGCIN